MFQDWMGFFTTLLNDSFIKYFYFAYFITNERIWITFQYSSKVR